MKKTFKIFIYLSFSLLFKTDLFAQRRPAFCGFNKSGGYFGYNRTAYTTARAYAFNAKEAIAGDESGVPDVVIAILKEFQIDVDIKVYIVKNEENCYATIGQGGIKMLVADVDFLEDVNRNSLTQWGAISVLAHEVGHHIAGFGRHEDRLQDEIDADYWSGWVLMKLGSSETAAVKCILKYGSEEDSPSHPNKNSRRNAISAGWNDAKNGRIDYSHCEDCKP